MRLKIIAWVYEVKDYNAPDTNYFHNDYYVR